MKGRARGGAIGIGLLMVLGGAYLAGRHGRGIGLILLGAALIASALWESRYRRKRDDTAPPGPGWQETGETFLDEESGQWVRVWYNPDTGERRYVPQRR